MGFSDEVIAGFTAVPEEEINRMRKSQSLVPTYKMVDTCAAEFAAETPYFYSTYETVNEAVPSNHKKVIIVGAGPIRIGQGIEFDYACVHGVMALQEEGVEAIIVNNNPETVSTDYDISDRLYFEPLTLEDVLNIIENEDAEELSCSSAVRLLSIWQCPWRMLLKERRQRFLELLLVMLM